MENGLKIKPLAKLHGKFTRLDRSFVFFHAISESQSEFTWKSCFGLELTSPHILVLHLWAPLVGTNAPPPQLRGGVFSDQALALQKGYTSRLHIPRIIN